LGTAVDPSLEIHPGESASSRASSLFALAAAFAITSLARAVPPPTEPPLYAEPARLAARGLLIAISAAGERLVAVGDRGIIVFSDDKGATWTQAAAVPTQALLTGVCFLDAQHGVAVGHDLVILTSADAGRHWTRTHYAPEAQRPLLDVWCGAGGRVIAVGAYSTYLTSADGGASWSEVKFTPAPAPVRIAGSTAGTGTAGTAPATGTNGEAGGGYHLNRIVAAGTTRLYIAGEAGHLYRSDDAGATWLTLPSPYEGSFFGVLPLTGEALLAFGLRGNLFRSADAGASWQKIATGTVVTLNGAARLPDGAPAVVGFSGVVLVSRDGGRTFALLQQADHTGLSAAVSVGNDLIAAVGEDGARVIRMNTVPAGTGSAP